MSDRSSVFEFGPFRFDGPKRVLWRAGEVVDVPPKALELLAVLLEQAGDVVGKEELLRRVWPDTFVEEANLSVNVAILRKTLGRSHIQTVARRGYRFRGPVSAAKVAPRALAVLPFRPIGPDVEEHLGLGMADALITRLGATLTVRPTSAIQKYAGVEVDPLEVGRALKVDAVLDGRLQREGARLRVTAQLLPTAGAAPLWTDRFEEEAENLFALQDTVAERLASALAAELGHRRRHTENLEAYQAYSRGRYFWSRFSPTWVSKAVASFQEAASLDRSYALPHAGLADTLVATGFTGVIPPRDAWDLAAAEAARARELDERLPEAHLSSAWIRLLQGWDWDGAETNFRRALELDPGSAVAHQWYGLFLDLRGRLDEASRAIAQAEELDPLSLVVSALRGFHHLLAGDYERALAQQRRTVELDPHQFLGHWALGIAFEHVGRHEEAVAEHRRALELTEGTSLMKPVLARSLALAGRTDEAHGLREELESEPGFVSPYQRATVSLVLGERERALALLGSACDERDAWVLLLGVDPMLAPLHAEPGFQELRSRLQGG